MMKFIISLVSLLGLLYIGNNILPAGKVNLPPIGNFFSPQTGFWQNGQSHYDDAVILPTISEDASALVDDRGVPHIRAKNEIEAARMLGYFHAKNRLFQMDMSTRYTDGRLSELLGKNTKKIDQLMRRRGLGYAAERALESWSQYPKTMDIVNAYTAGVNAYIDQLSPRDYPVEYKLIGASVEPWTTYKTALMNKSMAFDLCFRNQDAEATKSRTLLGEALYNELFPLRNKKEDPIIPSNTTWNIDVQEMIKSGAIIEAMYPPNHKRADQEYMPPEANGSNNWAIAADKTKNGNAILCNDPHLSLRLPSIWFETQLTTDDQNAYGVSIPGIPGIIIGFNEDIAWGVTNVGIDVLDWYGIQWTDYEKREYEIDGKIRKATPRIETINVKGQSPIIDTVWYTKWGPMTYGNDTSHYLHHYAMQWIGHDIATTDEMSTFIQLNKAKNISDYVQAASSFISPAQNMAFASRKGNIALRVSGGFPIRDGNTGEFLLDGSHSYNAWRGTIPANENPMVINPPRGFVSSANQISTDSTYPHEYYGYFDDYRGRQLNKKLRAMENITVDDMKSLQLDFESQAAIDGMELFNKLIPTEDKLSDTAKKYHDMIMTWNKEFRANSIEPVVFMKWLSEFQKETWDEFSEKNTSFKKPELWRTIELGISEPGHKYFDLASTSTKETAEQIAINALENIAQLLDKDAASNKDLSWGQFNASQVKHLMGLKAFSSDINLVDGCRQCLNAVQGNHGPSWRMIVELSDPVQAWGVYPGGQSGHPGDEHYMDFIPTWTDGEYYSLNFISKSADWNELNGQQIKFSAK